MRFPLPLLVVTVWACGSDQPVPREFGPGGVLGAVGEFTQVSSYDTTGGNRDRLEITAGDSAVILDVEGPGVIRRIWITVSSRDPHYLRRIGVRMYWDGEADPSVQAPLGDFFGNAFDRRHYTALPMGASSGGFYSYLPMPFRRRGRIVVTNGTGRTIDAFYFNIGVETGVVLPRSLETLHAEWRRTPRTDTSDPHRVLEAWGRGRFVGMAFNAESYDNNLEFLEGDERYLIDGRFAGQGTGTEDYFNAGWYFEAGEFAAPFHGLIVKDEARGRIAAYRWHLPDPVGFRDSIRITLEHGHANKAVADVATVAYWYQVEPHRPYAPMAAPLQRRVLGVKMAGEATLVASSAVVHVAVPRPDRYDVIAYPLGRPGGGSGTISVGEPTPVSTSTTFEAEDSATILPPVLVGRIVARDSVEIRTDPGSLAGVHLRPVRVWATAWNVTGPFPNPQRVGTEYSPALDSVYPPEQDAALDREYPTGTGRSAGWFTAEAGPDGQVRLRRFFDETDWVVAYARTFFYLPRARDVTLLVGADDGHLLWVNGTQVSVRQGRHISRADDIGVTVHARAGWNDVLLKVANLDGGWAFQMRAADPDDDIRWSRRPGGVP